MTNHIVLLKFKPETAPETIDFLFGELEALSCAIPGIVSFCGGVNDSPEPLSRGYTHGFVMTFDSSESRDAYLPHPDHVAAAGKLVAQVEGGVDGVLVLDFEVGP